MFCFLAIAALFTSCSKDSDNDSNELADGVVSQWELIEQYSDPGDGSGGFEAVTGEKYIVFYDDGTIICYGQLCSLQLENTEASNGVYDADALTITADDCSGQVLLYSYVDSNLILSFPCDEPCQEKYIQTATSNLPTN